jgi:hypothetical protein
VTGFYGCALLPIKNFRENVEGGWFADDFFDLDAPKEIGGYQ